MKYAFCVIAASLTLAACSQGQPGSSGLGTSAAGYQQPGPGYGGYSGPTRGGPTAGRMHSNFHAAQSLKERVIREVVQASQGGEDVSAAKRFEERGEEALRQGEITLAAEQFGRAEEALAMSRGPEGSVRERTEEMTEEEEETGRHRHHRHHRRQKEEASESSGKHKEEASESSGRKKEEASESTGSTESKEGKESSETSTSSASSGLTRDRVKNMADKVKSDISSAKDNGEDVSDAQRHKNQGDKALDGDQLPSAMNHYKMAEKALKNARAGDSNTSEGTSTEKKSSEESTSTGTSTGTSGAPANGSEGGGAASPESGTSSAPAKP